MIISRRLTASRMLASAVMAAILAALAGGDVLPSGDDDGANQRSAGGGFELVSDSDSDSDVAVLRGGEITLVGSIAIDTATELKAIDVAALDPEPVDAAVVKPATKDCAGDLNHDGAVDVDDVLAMIESVEMGVDDLLTVIEAWGACP